MAFRVGLLDITAAAVVAVAILLPPREQPVDALYEGEAIGATRVIASLQADLAARPNDGAVTQRLAETLLVTNQSDWALRVAGAFAARGEGPERWRALLAVSEVHADRYEIKAAWEWADKSVKACDAPDASCAVHERARLDTYATALKAGLDSGIDPRVDPKGFEDAIKSKIPTITVKPPKTK